MYDPASAKFTATGTLRAARFVHSATLLPNGKVFMAGGDNAYRFFASSELYDPANGTFTATGSLTTARRYHTATLLPGGKVLITGGHNPSAVATAELYRWW